jgi:hypothetical protein
MKLILFVLKLGDSMFRSIIVAALVVLISAGSALAKGAAECCSENGGCQKTMKNGKKPAAGSMYEIKVTQSGGIAGIHREMTVNTATLKKPQQARFAELVADTGILKVEETKKLTAGAADMFIYDFEVNCCGKVHKAEFDEGTLPASYKSLREYMNTVQKK